MTAKGGIKGVAYKCSLQEARGALPEIYKCTQEFAERFANPELLEKFHEVNLEVHTFGDKASILVS